MRRLSFDLERGHVPARRGAEQPPVLAAQLGQAFVPDAEHRLGRVEPLTQRQPFLVLPLFPNGAAVQTQAKSNFMMEPCRRAA
jgi:hypothetical protein